MRESEWLDLLREGNFDWFEELVDAYKHRVYALCYRKTFDASEAEDLAQEIFLQFYRKLPLFRGEAALSTWLYRVALNCAASYVRKRRTPLLPGAPPEMASEGEPGDELLERERSETVMNALSRLKNKEREVLELFYFQRHSTAKVAEILGIAPRGVETRLRRARESMKRALAGTGYFEEVTGDARNGSIRALV